MGNLGWYQVMTTLAKKVGGPKKLFWIVFGGGAMAGGSITFGGMKIKKRISKVLEEKKKEEESAKVYEITDDGKSNEGLVFVKGDKFKVLEVDGDVALIEKIGDDNNPYVVALSFLKTISNFGKE